MASLLHLLQNLRRPEVGSLILESGRPARLEVGAASEPLAEPSPTSDEIFQLLFSMGGSRYLETLGSEPVRWTFRVPTVGPVRLSVIQRGDALEVRFERASAASDLRSTTRSRQPDAVTPPPISVAPTERPPAFFTDFALNDPAVDPRFDRGAYPPDSPSPAPPSVAALEPPRVIVPSSPHGLALGAAELRPTALRQPRVPPQGDLVRWALEQAREAGASDVHLVPGRAPLFRVLGALVPRGEPLDPAELEPAALALVPARLRERFDADGSCDFALDVPGLGRHRVNLGRQRTGIKLSARLVPRSIPTLASLGLPEAIATACRHHQGLIVLTGPSGQGKTSTLAALVDVINRERPDHVITVEDPVEYVHECKRAIVSQREVGTHTKSFQSALKASLREDPDVVVVGELRDTETVRMALSASETGHLVLGTMNTPSAAKTIDRLVDLFPPAEHQQVRLTLAGGLKLIVSQRLLPNANGAGMVAAAEILPGSVPLWNLIRDGKTYQIPSLQQRGKGLGIVRLDDSLADLVRFGLVELAAALAVAEAPDELRATLAAAAPAAPRAAPAGPPHAAAPAPEEDSPRGLLQRAGALLGRKS